MLLLYFVHLYILSELSSQSCLSCLLTRLCIVLSRYLQSICKRHPLQLCHVLPQLLHLMHVQPLIKKVACNLVWSITTPKPYSKYLSCDYYSTCVAAILQWQSDNAIRFCSYDLGGSAVYKVLHQHFLDKDAITLLVYNHHLLIEQVS